MRQTLLLVVLVIFVAAVTSALLEDQEQWLIFKEKHAKTYSDTAEETQRFQVFQENLRTIEAHNLLYQAGQATYQMGVTKFTDWKTEEFQALLKKQSSSKPVVNRAEYFHLVGETDLPNATDWRDVDAVTRVKDQGSCGSCWAFSVTGTLESFYYLRYNEKVEFSEQQLLDCDTSNQGCIDGEEAPAMEYFVENGIISEDTYPYMGKKQTCKYNQSDVKAYLEAYIPIEPGDEDTLLRVVGFLGPTSVALDGTRLPFYTSGIFTDNTCSQNTTNHAVLAVGYGHDNTTNMDYWIIKNSWGTLWGEEGYFRIQRGTNECAIAMDSVYPSFGIQPNTTEDIASY